MELLLDAKEVKKILRCSLPLVYKLADRGQIPCIRIPCPGIGTERTRTMVRFKKADVLSFIEKHYRPSDCISGIHA
jgi:hypothetical protein